MSEQTTTQSSIFEQTFKTISQTICSICTQGQELKQNIQQSQAVQSLREFNQTFGRQVCMPLTNWYRAFPPQFTQTKFDLIQQYSYNMRLNAVNALAVTAALITYKRTPAKIVQGSFLAIKSAGLMYLIAGLCIAPEIYNPLMYQ